MTADLHLLGHGVDAIVQHDLDRMPPAITPAALPARTMCYRRIQSVSLREYQCIENAALHICASLGNGPIASVCFNHMQPPPTRPLSLLRALFPDGRPFNQVRTNELVH